mgnify:FL=1
MREKHLLLLRELLLLVLCRAHVLFDGASDGAGAREKGAAVEEVEDGLFGRFEMVR